MHGGGQTGANCIGAPDGAPDGFSYGEQPTRAYEIQVPLTYDPPVGDPADLKTVLQDKPNGDSLASCYAQTEPVHKLPDLTGVPVIVVASEASYHASCGHCRAKWLAQAGAESKSGFPDARSQQRAGRRPVVAALDGEQPGSVAAKASVLHRDPALGPWRR